MEYVCKFWVPRNRLQYKDTRNDPVKGVDVVAIKFKIDSQTHSHDDILSMFESKASLSKKDYNTLQNAIKDSSKDYSKDRRNSKCY